MTTSHDSPLLNYLSLFASLGTLICCALPSLLVFLGLGATVASFLSAVPWLVMFSRHKIWVFTIAGTLIGGNFLYVYFVPPTFRAQAEACPVDAPTGCDNASRVTRAVLWISAVIYFVGFCVAYLLGLILMRLDS